MHQVGDARNRLGLDSERFQLVDESPIDLSGRRDREVSRMVLVEHQAHPHTTFDGVRKRSEDGRSGTSGQPQIVDGDVERLGGQAQEACDARRHRVRGLAAVGEKKEIERGGDGSDGGYRASALRSPASTRGSSTWTGSGLVAISAACSGSSVRLTRSKSSGDIAPRPRTTFRIQSSSPDQYSVPKRTIGKCSIFPVCASVSDSKSSSRVPSPPGKITKPRAYLTNMFLRTKKYRNSTPRSTYLLSDCSCGSSMLQPTDRPPASWQPLLTASMIPGPPPVITAKPRLASAAPS